MVKLIAIDIDGTLLNSGGDIPVENKEALQFASKKGTQIVISTGRSYQGIKYLLASLGIEGYTICCNGAEVRKIGETEVVFQKSIPSYLVEEIVTRLEINEISVNVYIHDMICALGENRVKAYYDYVNSKVSPDLQCNIKLMSVNDILEIVRTKKVYKFEIPVSNQIAAQAVKSIIEDSKVIKGFGSWDKGLEFISTNAGKETALVEIQQKLGLEREAIMAIGDYHNDIEMIKYAGVGVAMGNALPDVKSVADFITEDCDNGGVAKAIYNFL